MNEKMKDGLTISLKGKVTKTGMYNERPWFEVSWMGGVKRFFDELVVRVDDDFEGLLSVNDKGFWNIEQTFKPLART